jgi:hypothetical protein
MDGRGRRSWRENEKKGRFLQIAPLWLCGLSLFGDYVDSFSCGPVFRSGWVLR